MNEVKINGIYKHFKGDYYILEDVALSSDDGVTPYILYRQLYGDGKLYVREQSDFLEEVNHEKYPQVTQKYKFELQNVESVRNSFK